MDKNTTSACQHQFLCVSNDTHRCKRCSVIFSTEQMIAAGLAARYEPNKPASVVTPSGVTFQTSTQDARPGVFVTDGKSITGITLSPSVGAGAGIEGSDAPFSSYIRNPVTGLAEESVKITPMCLHCNNPRTSDEAMFCSHCTAHVRLFFDSMFPDIEYAREFSYQLFTDAVWTDAHEKAEVEQGDVCKPPPPKVMGVVRKMWERPEYAEVRQIAEARAKRIVGRR